MNKLALLSAISIILTGGYANAQEVDHSAHNHAAKSNSEAPSTIAFDKANAEMHKQMNIQYSGNADVDFVKGMIPHHQGAVDMAKIVLQYGKDPEIKKLAEDIIKAQEVEIKQMQDWLKKNDK